MKKSVLISIQPKWCELIASGKKTVEVRKTKPRLHVPFTVYIYQTKKTWVYNIFSKIADWQGKVIGEFVCDEIIVAELGHYCNIPCKEAQLDVLDLMDYADEKTVYGWHISNLVIYDKPKKLSEFERACPYNEECWKCKYYDNGSMEEPPSCNWQDFELIRPSQSWCYVEELSK